MAQELMMSSARNVQTMSEFVAAHEFHSVELVCKTTSSGKKIHRLRFDGACEFKVSPKAYRLISEGELSLMDLQYAEYCTTEGKDEWVSLFVPAGAKIVGEDILAKTTF